MMDFYFLASGSAQRRKLQIHFTVLLIEGCGGMLPW